MLPPVMAVALTALPSCSEAQAPSRPPSTSPAASAPAQAPAQPPAQVQAPSAAPVTAVAVGGPAPDFTLPYLVPKDGGGFETRQVTLSAFRGQKNVVLAFFPAAFSPG
jgi:hypothetical protein